MKSDQIDNLASEMFEGDFQLLADCINEALHKVSADLKPLELESVPPAITSDVPSEYTIEPYSVEYKLSHIKSFQVDWPW